MSPSNSISTKKNLGYFYGTALGITTALMGVFVHNVKDHSSPQDVVVFRTFWMSIILLPFAVRELAKLKSKEGSWLWGRSVFGALGLYCFFANLQEASVSSALLLSSLSSLFVVIATAFIFKEPLRRLQVGGALVVCIGVIFLRAFGSNEISSFVLLRGLLGALATASAFIMLKRAAGIFSAPTVVFVMSIVTCIVVFPFSNVTLDTMMSLSSYNLLGVLAFSLATQILLTLTYRDLPSAVAAALSESAIFWGAALDIAIFGIWLTPSATVLYLVIFAGILMLKYERKQPTPLTKETAPVTDQAA